MELTLVIRHVFVFAIAAFTIFSLQAAEGQTTATAISDANRDQEKRSVTLTILHTNDLHGHLSTWQGWEGDLKGKMVGGLGRLGGAIKQVREELGQNILLVDAGDLLGDTMIAGLTKGSALVAAWNYLGYDALAIGNHEIDFGTDVLMERVKEAKFAVVSANLVKRSGGELFTKPYIIKTVNGVSVGVLGLAYPNTPKTTVQKNVADVEFQDPVAAVERYLPKMRSEGAQITVVLSHLGLGGDKHLAQAVKGIDVIIGGHSHNRMERAERIGDTLIVQAGAHGSDLGRLDLSVVDGTITGHNRTLIPLDHDKIPADTDADQLARQLIAPHEATLNEEIGTAKDWLIRAQTLAGQEARKRDEESPIDSLFADILRQETETDIALLPGVGYGVAIPPGPVTAAQLRQMIPHDGKVVTMQLTGAQVMQVLEQAIENTFTEDPKRKVGGMIQVSGIRFCYDSSKEKGHRLASVERTEGTWDETARYTIVTNSMMAGGGHNYDVLSQGQNRTDLGSQYEMVRSWITKNSPVVTPPTGRICNVDQ